MGIDDDGSSPGEGDAGNSIGIGTYALRACKYGSDNVSIGAYSSDAIHNGKENVAIGTRALSENVSGNHNVAIGRDSLYKYFTNMNIGVGYQAIYNLANGTGMGGNIGIGHQSLHAITTGYNNTAIGHLSGHTNPVDSQNTICIGYGANVTGNNMCRIGNDNIKVGIGTSSPGEKLEVKDGNISLCKNGSSLTDIDIAAIKFKHKVDSSIIANLCEIAAVGDSIGELSNGYAMTQSGRLEFRTLGPTSANASGGFNPLTRMTVDSNGNVGIGTTSPGDQLEVFKTDGEASISIRSDSETASDRSAVLYFGVGKNSGNRRKHIGIFATNDPANERKAKLDFLY